MEIVSPWTQRGINREAGATVFIPVAMLTAFGSTKRADYVDGGEAWKEYDSLRESELNHEAAAALIAVVQVWIKRLNIQGGHTVTAQAADACRMCQILGPDLAAIEAEAVRAIPQPKSWTGLDEQRTPTTSEKAVSSRFELVGASDHEMEDLLFVVGIARHRRGQPKLQRHRPEDVQGKANSAADRRPPRTRTDRAGIHEHQTTNVVADEGIRVFRAEQHEVVPADVVLVDAVALAHAAELEPAQ
jgi:hypothetical protein